MFFKQLLQSSTVRLALIALVLSGIILTGSQPVSYAKASQGELAMSQQTEQLVTTATTASPSSTQEAKSFTCTDVSIAANIESNLVIVFCGNRPPEGDFFQFVVRSESKWASRVTALVLAAMASSKSVGIIYNLTPSTVPNCDPANCRELLWLGYSG